MSTSITAIRNLPTIPPKFWLAATACSFALHIGMLQVANSHVVPEKIKPAAVRVAIKEPEAPLPLPEKPKEKPKKQPKPTPTPNQVLPNAKPDTPPIQGLTKDSTSDKGTFSAPVGNTLMVEDTGKRVKPDDVGALKGDLSAPASLIRESVKTPPYTDQALDASLEGSWIVDVYVDLSGKVTSAELRKKIGFGMDERVLSAAKDARFTPRKNKFGAFEAGWAEIKFTLVIP